MGDYFTNRRSLSYGLNSYDRDGIISSSISDKTAFDGSVARAQNEVTVSYRSRGPDSESLSGIEDSVLLSDLSYADRFKIYKGQYLRDKGENDNSLYDTGHTFSSEKRYWIAPRIGTSWSRLGHNDHYLGRISVGNVNDTSNTYVSIPAFNLAYYGPLAIRICKPNSPHVDLSVTLGEIRREGIPNLPTRQLLGSRPSLRNAAGEYLNIEFGLRPLIRDFGKFLESVVSADLIIQQYQRDAGRLVRRRMTFPPIITTTTSTLANPNGYVSENTNTTESRFMWGTSGGTGDRRGILLTTTTTTQSISFSGAFTYHLQSEGSIFEKMKYYGALSNKLFGIRLTPETLWNLQPWSWFADWNYNIGANISNATSLASDGLVLKYGYMMVDTVSRRDYTVVGPRLLDGNSGPWTNSFIIHRKERFRAQPYGFSSNPNSYTNRQWAILGALGIAKAPKILH